MENSMEVLLINMTTIRSSNFIPGYLSEENENTILNICIPYSLKNYLQQPRHGNNLSVPQWPEWIKKMWCTYNRILFNHKKEGSLAICNNMDWLGGHSLVAQTVNNLPSVQETRVWSLGREDPLEKQMATHATILAWRIPWTDEPGGLQSMIS